jgi:hypothetical protein
MDGRRLGAVLCRTAVVLLALLASGGGVAGDAALARFLLDGGKADLRKGDLADAATKLEKARVEDPDLLEAAWVLGQVREKQGASAEALRAYREFLEALDRKEQAGTATKEETGLRKRVAARADALGAGEKELRAVREAFVRNLLAFARAEAEKDATIAARALRLLLQEDPRHAAATDLLARLGQRGAEPTETATSPAAPPPTSYPGISRWTDLIAEKTFGLDDDWTYAEDGTLKVAKRGGTLTRPTTSLDTGERFVLEMEVRVLEELERGWAVGFAFDDDGNDFLNTILLKSEVVLVQQRNGERSDVGRGDLRPIEREAWHRLAVVVADGKVAVWFDGKKVLDAEPSVDGALGGNIALFHQRCAAQFRVLRLGRPE